MPVFNVAIDPVTRLEGHLKVDVAIDKVNGEQQVVDAHCIGTLFRGFEKLMEDRDPRDAPIITSRICGVCPTSHAHCASLTLDHAFGVAPPDNARILRNLVDGACFLESHILHFFLLSLPDFLQGPHKGPWMPGWDVGKRINKATGEALTAGYLSAIETRRKVHEMGAIFGGKLPHTPAYIAGGFTAVATSAERSDFRAILTEVTDFLNNVQLPQVEQVASLYDEYFSIGRGYANLLSYGSLDLNAAGTAKFFDRGRIVNGLGSAVAVDLGEVTEHVTHSWYEDSTNDLHPSTGATLPQHPKAEGYSWLKSPRYGGDVYEVGPLARMWVNGEYTNGVSVMDRHRARVREAILVAEAMDGWLDELVLQGSSYVSPTLPSSGTGFGLMEAPRGALGHWLEITDSRISHYQVLTPTCWNASPRDTAGQPGPLEQALIGTPVANADEPIEVLRVVHSFDPCMDCATHVSRPK